jgi:hypothetical protein
MLIHNVSVEDIQELEYLFAENIQHLPFDMIRYDIPQWIADLWNTAKW